MNANATRQVCHCVRRQSIRQVCVIIVKFRIRLFQASENYISTFVAFLKFLG